MKKNGSIVTLRRCLKISQKELAVLAECKVSAIQRIEYGTLKISEGLAARIAMRTGAGYNWLISGEGGDDVRTSDGRAMSATELARLRQSLRSPSMSHNEITVIRTGYLEVCYRLAKVLLAACEKGAQHTCLFGINELLRDMERDYEMPSSVLARRMSPGHIDKDRTRTSITFDMLEIWRTFDEALRKDAPKAFHRRMR